MAGTVFVKDINAGPGSSSPPLADGVFFAMPGGAVFFADDGVNRTQLWKTDGTAAGTFMLPQVLIGTSNSIVGNPPIAIIADKLFFPAADGLVGNELWVSDGSEAGTALVKDISPGPVASSIQLLTRVQGSAINTGGILMFRANDGINGHELWSSDGTFAGTMMVKNIHPGSSNPLALTNVNGTLYFTANNGTNGIELWKSDGTTANTVLVKDITPGSASSGLSNLASVGNMLFFQLANASSANQLWKSDGTDPGTVLVKDITPGVLVKNLSQFTDVNGILYFTANDGANGVELWKSDGTGPGTVLVKDINPGSAGSNPAKLTAVNGVLYFVADDGTHGSELWTSNGTSLGTVMVKDLTPGLAGSVLSGVSRTGSGRVVFAVGTNSPSAGPGSLTQLWSSDGTDAGTVLVKDLCAGKPACFAAINPNLFFEHSGFVFFAAYDETGSQFWRTDGTAAGTVAIFALPIGIPNFGRLLGANTQGIFLARSNGITGREPWFYRFSIVPTAFAFAPAIAAPNTVITSDAITPGGFDIPVPITVSAGSYSIGCTATFVTAPGSIAPRQSVCVRHTTAATPGTLFTTTLTIGGVVGTFTSTSGIAPSITSASATTFTVTQPGSFTFTASGTPAVAIAVTGALPGGVTYSAAGATLSGTPLPGSVGAYPLTVTGGNSVPPNALQNFTLTVAKAAQTIVFAALADRAPSSPPFTISATGGASGNAVAFTSSTTLVCNTAGTNGNTVIIFGTGLCTITANQPGNADYLAAAPVAQSFNVKLAQTIAFAPLPNRSVGDPLFTVSATGGASGIPVVFSTTTTTICQTGGVNGSSVVVFAPGTCTLDADQAGDASYLAAPRVSQSFLVSAAGTPGAPTIGSAIAGNGTATIAFSPPASSGSSAISAYTATCVPGGFTAAGAASPILVTGLANGTLYNCTVFATNASGAGPPSAPLSVTPSNAVVLLATLSRKIHGAAGPCDMAISGAASVEPRTAGTGHQVVFRFNGPISAAGTATAVNALASPVGIAFAKVSGNDVIVVLIGIPDNEQVLVSLAGVNGSVNASVSLGFLVGDVNSSRAVNAADISAVKANLSRPVDNSTCKFDLDTSGVINSLDVTVAKARAGLALPP